MEVRSTAASDSANWSQRFAESLSRQRTRVAEFLAAKRLRTEQAGARLAQHRQFLAAEVGRGRDELRQELDAARQREAALTAELTALGDEHRQAAAELARLREAETHRREEMEPSPAALLADAAIAERGGYVRRYELAMEDARRLRAENAELQQQLSAAAAARPQASPPSEGVLDWEAEKRRVLAALEAGALGDEEGARDDRLKIEHIIRTTEQLVARKDRQIADLEHLLSDQSCNLKSVAVGAAALGQILDQDAVVCEERENLKRLQDEWREKLREAEIDISVQRAKLARERAELDEKLRVSEERQSPKPGAGTGDEKPARGRWLAKLGLKDGEGGPRPAGER